MLIACTIQSALNEVLAYAVVLITFLFFLSEEPRFQKKANTLAVTKGESTTFRCRPLNTGRIMMIKWRRNGQTLENGSKYEVGDETLTVKNVAREDCGEYYCVARDGQSIFTSVGALTIKDGKYICMHG